LYLTVVSDNGDGRKVLATVSFTLTEFFSVYPDDVVFFTGSSNLRTRVYGRAIDMYWADIAEHFFIEGINSICWTS
jgi:hypothetical protein